MNPPSMEKSALSPESSRPLPVVIVDDHPVLVSFLTEVLERQGRYRIVGRAETAAAALEVCHRHKPVLVILDLALLDSNDLDCLKRLRSELPRTHVLIFTGSLGTALVGDMLVEGADGILGKTARVTEIIEAVDRVAQGGMYLCAQACEAVRKLVQEGPADRLRRPELSRRELTVLQHIAAGLSTKQIAARMGLSRNTINAFRGRIMRKTGRHSVADLVLYAARLGLVRVPGLRVATTNPTG
jgi:two-component system, NarL family, nitrate/nitrite response regulator NarL